jgi:hypothetical protein
MQFLVIGIGLLLITLNTLSTPEVRATFVVDKNPCIEEEKKYLSEGKGVPSPLTSHCAFLEKYVVVLEGVQVQLSTWLEQGLVLFVTLNSIFVLIEALILFRQNNKSKGPRSNNN